MFDSISCFLNRIVWWYVLKVYQYSKCNTSYYHSEYQSTSIYLDMYLYEIWYIIFAVDLFRANLYRKNFALPNHCTKTFVTDYLEEHDIQLTRNALGTPIVCTKISKRFRFGCGRFRQTWNWYYFYTISRWKQSVIISIKFHSFQYTFYSFSTWNKHHFESFQIPSLFPPINPTHEQCESPRSLDSENQNNCIFRKTISRQWRPTGKLLRCASKSSAPLQILVMSYRFSLLISPVNLLCWS